MRELTSLRYPSCSTGFFETVIVLVNVALMVPSRGTFLNTGVHGWKFGRRTLFISQRVHLHSSGRCTDVEFVTCIFLSQNKTSGPSEGTDPVQREPLAAP